LSLDAAARRRFARQLLLGEIGDAGQERLLAAEFVAGAGADADAYAAAADYLRRAGCAETDSGREVQVPDSSEVTRFAGASFLRGPAASLVGAFCAVEHLKGALGLAEVQTFPTDLHLHAEG